MKEIRDFLFENMPIPAQREYLHEAFDATEQCEFIKTEMARAYNPWRAAYLEMVRVYETALGDAQVTDRIVQLDLQRDQMLHAIDVAVEAGLKSIDPAMVAAARELEQTKTSFPVNPRKGYLYQTAQIDSYVAVMLGEQAENATKVGVLALVNILKDINDQIHTLVNERGESRVEKGNDPSRPDARKAAIDAWRTQLKYVNGYNLVILGATQPNPELDNFIDLMNEKGDRFRSIYLTGKKKPADGETPEAPDEDTPPNDSENSEGSEDSENSENSGEQGGGTGGSGSLTPDTNPPSGGDNTGGGGNTNPGGGYVPPSNGGGFD